MAAEGDFVAADSLLAMVGADTSPSVEMLMLRAKMFAQQRRFDDAMAAFGRILAVQPDHSEAREGLRLAERLRRKPAMWMHFTRRLVGIGVAFAAVTILFALWATDRPPAPRVVDPVLLAVQEAQREQAAAYRDSSATIRLVERRLALLEQKSIAADTARLNEVIRLRRQLSKDIERLRLDLTNK
jgi:hypothetical protein